MLDVGYECGKVEPLIFVRIPGAHVVGGNNSVAMAAWTVERLHGHTNRFVPLRQPSIYRCPFSLCPTYQRQPCRVRTVAIHSLLRPAAFFC